MRQIAADARMSMSAYTRTLLLGGTLPDGAALAQIDVLAKAIADLNRLGGLMKMLRTNTERLQDIGYDMAVATIDGIFTDIRFIVEKLEVTCSALNMAILARKPEAGLLHHSDRGVQYASYAYQSILSRCGMVCSMSRKGNCWDNAGKESFWGKLKTEWIRGRIFSTREEAKREIFEYIEVFYNRQRRHSALGYVSPAEFEQRGGGNNAA